MISKSGISRLYVKLLIPFAKLAHTSAITGPSSVAGGGGGSSSSSAAGMGPAGGGAAGMMMMMGPPHFNTLPQSRVAGSHHHQHFAMEKQNQRYKQLMLSII